MAAAHRARNSVLSCQALQPTLPVPGALPGMQQQERRANPALVTGCFKQTLRPHRWQRRGEMALPGAATVRLVDGGSLPQGHSQTSSYNADTASEADAADRHL